ncbi:hypothetical protein D4R51_03685 [bacterium]|nr:MAG: hypothetical protein D4R51_03685 [bacterium]
MRIKEVDFSTSFFIPPSRLLFQPFDIFRTFGTFALLSIYDTFTSLSAFGIAPLGEPNKKARNGKTAARRA